LPSFVCLPFIAPFEINLAVAYFDRKGWNIWKPYFCLAVEACSRRFE
jgi:hypothetical protein